MWARLRWVVKVWLPKWLTKSVKDKNADVALLLRAVTACVGVVAILCAIWRGWKDVDPQKLIASGVALLLAAAVGKK